MPTIEEHMEGVIEWVQRGVDHECSWCNGTSVREDHYQTPCKCPTCKGAGFYELAGAAKRKCALCKGSGEWHEFLTRDVPCDCDEGTVRHARTDPSVQHGVLNACIGAMYGAREEGSFDRMNRILDWAWKYSAECMATAVAEMRDNPELQESVAAKMQAAGAPEAKERRTKFAPSPIPPEELEKLLADHEAE
jgi:hypothetical protein